MRRVLLLAVLLSPQLARASTVVALEEAELVSRADTIVYGRVDATQAVRTARGRVVTLVELEVFRGLRGLADGQRMSFAVPGGFLDGLDADVPGAPRPKVGDLVFGFFETRGGERRPLGMSYGLLQVRGVSNELRVFRDAFGLQLVSPTGEGVAPGAMVIDGEPLADFTARIASRLSGMPPAPGPLPSADGVRR
jgi:hypothetical protein